VPRIHGLASGGVISGTAPEVAHLGTTSRTETRTVPVPSKTGKKTKLQNKVVARGIVTTPCKEKAKSTSMEHGVQSWEPKKDSKATRKRVVQYMCSQSESQILAEAAVDISEILLGDGIHKINPLQDRVRLAIKKAQSIKKAVDHDEYDRLLPDSPANTLPKITPGALLKWLDREFKDVIDAVFFVDSQEEFAKLLQTFAQGIAGIFFGEKIRIDVAVDPTTQKEEQPPAISNDEMPVVRPDSARFAPPPPNLSACPEGTGL
jgi:hypothetical protein